MKVLIIIDNLGSGGAQKQLVSLAIGLQKHKINVNIFAYNFKDNFFNNILSKNKVKIFKYRKYKKGFSFSVLKKLRTTIKINKYDFAISFLNPSNMYLLFSSINLPIKLIFTERSSYLSYKHELLAVLQRQFYRFSDHIVSNSKSQKEWLVQKVKIESKKISVIYNGYSINQIKISKSNNNSFKYKLLSIGRIHNEKNIHFLISALIRFYEKYNWIPKIDWVGRIDDQNYFNFCNELINKNKFLSNSWNWRGETKSIEKFIKQTDALIHTASYDGLSNVICESLVFGHPVITADVCDNKYLIGNDKRGFLFKPNNIPSICRTLKKFYNSSPDHMYQIKSSALAYAKENLDLVNLIQNYKQLLEKLKNEKY